MQLQPFQKLGIGLVSLTLLTTFSAGLGANKAEAHPNSYCGYKSTGTRDRSTFVRARRITGNLYEHTVRVRNWGGGVHYDKVPCLH